MPSISLRQNSAEIHFRVPDSRIPRQDITRHFSGAVMYRLGRKGKVVILRDLALGDAPNTGHMLSDNCFVSADGMNFFQTKRLRGPDHFETASQFDALLAKIERLSTTIPGMRINPILLRIDRPGRHLLIVGELGLVKAYTDTEPTCQVVLEPVTHERGSRLLGAGIFFGTYPAGRRVDTWERSLATAI